ncbi:MAG: hypothetical protein AAF843_13690 [Bacteroidota bacterium]
MKVALCVFFQKFTCRSKIPFYLILSLSYFIVGGCQENQNLITFSKDIAPIIRNNCTACHNPKGPGPFTLFSYEDVSKRSKMILEVLETGYMPPWYADSSYRHFENERFLDKKQIGKIAKWVEQGKEKGSWIDLDKVDNYVFESEASQLSYTFQQPLQLKGNNEEYFVKIIVPFENDEELPIKATDFVPGAKKYVHHSNYGIYEVDEKINFDDFDFQPLYANEYDESIDAYAPLLTKLRFYLGWIPGSGPVQFEDGYGFTLPKKGVILFTLHYAPSPIDFEDQSRLRLYVSEMPLQKKLQSISLGSGGLGRITPKLELPPESIDTFRLKEHLPMDIRIHYVWPHMHLLGRAFESFAVLPNQDTLPIIRIPQWDFDWQEGYKMIEPLPIPRNSMIHIKASYDNTSANPNNPFDPPQTVYSTGLMETKKEMMTLVMLYSRD